MVKWEVILKEPVSCFHRPGQPVVGIVKCTVKKRTRLNKLFLSFEGRSNFALGDNRVTVVSNETIVEPQGVERSFDEPVLPGVHEYPFRFTLPLGIPSSYKKGIKYVSRLCHVIYMLKLTIESGGCCFSDKKIEKEIFVRGYLPLRMPEEPPGGYALQKPLGVFSQGEQIIKLKVKVPRRGVSPGDGVELHFHVINDSDVAIKSIKTELIRTLSLTAMNVTHEKHKTFDECTVETTSVDANREAELKSLLKTLPDLYSIEELKSLGIYYSLKVTVRLPIPHTNPFLFVPIVIGDVMNEPIREEQLLLSVQGSVNMVFGSTSPF